MQTYRVSLYEYRYMNFIRLFKSAGAPHSEAKTCLERHFGCFNGHLLDCDGFGAPFDHGDIYGRDRTPLFLIGHPYQLSSDAERTLAAIRSLGLTVLVADKTRSWYGFGTLRVSVFSEPALASVCGSDVPRFDGF
jgi:hypothetical protein